MDLHPDPWRPFAAWRLTSILARHEHDWDKALAVVTCIPVLQLRYSAGAQGLCQGLHQTTTSCAGYRPSRPGNSRTVCVCPGTEEDSRLARSGTQGHPPLLRDMDRGIRDLNCRSSGAPRHLPTSTLFTYPYQNGVSRLPVSLHRPKLWGRHVRPSLCWIQVCHCLHFVYIPDNQFWRPKDRPIFAWRDGRVGSSTSETAKV